jgi:hypothetical protein
MLGMRWSKGSVPRIATCGHIQLVVVTWCWGTRVCSPYARRVHVTRRTVEVGTQTLDFVLRRSLTTLERCIWVPSSACPNALWHGPTLVKARTCIDDVVALWCLWSYKWRTTHLELALADDSYCDLQHVSMSDCMDRGRNQSLATTKVEKVFLTCFSCRFSPWGRYQAKCICWTDVRVAN